MNKIWEFLIKIKAEIMARLLDENLDGTFPRRKQSSSELERKEEMNP